jgi:hypothetical protein
MARIRMTGFRNLAILLACVLAGGLAGGNPSLAQNSDPAPAPGVSPAPTLAPIPPAVPATPKPLGSFKSWQAFTFEDKGRMMCYTQSSPAGSIGKVGNRGQAAVMVIQAPDAAAKDQVSIVFGFVPQDGKPVTVRFGRRRFILKKFAVGRAWADTANLDQQIVNAMQRSDWMVVYSVSAKGEKMQDTYNLSGFGKAYSAAVQACK